MITLSLDPATLLAAVGAGSALFWMPRIAKTQSRARQLEECAQYLRLHHEAVDMFAQDERASPDLRHFVLDLSESLENDETVISLANYMLGERKSGSPIDGDCMNDLNTLASTAPEARALLEAAITTGCMAAFLRVDTTASVFSRLVVKILAAPQTGAFQTAGLFGGHNRPSAQVRDPVAA